LHKQVFQKAEVACAISAFLKLRGAIQFQIEREKPYDYLLIYKHETICVEEVP